MKPLLLLATVASSASALPPEPKFTAQDIDRSVQIGYGVAIADVDGDKRPDILLADKKQIRWYKNPGQRGAEWPKYVLAENLTKNDNVCIAAQDLDGDGKCEVAVGAEWNPGDTVGSGAVFYLIPPADRTQPWEAVKFPTVEPTTHRMKWVPLGEKEWGLVVVPLHGRGNKNGEGEGAKVLCYRKPTDVKGEWKADLVEGQMHKTHNLDPHFDTKNPAAGVSLLIGGAEGAKQFQWKDGAWKAGEMPLPARAGVGGSPGVGELRRGQIATAAGASIQTIATIEPMHGNSVVVYRYQGAEMKPLPRLVLADDLNEGHALAGGDLLGIQSDQWVVGMRGTGGKPKPVGIAIWTSVNDDGSQWRKSVVDEETACEDVAIADLDGDGHLDLIAAGRASHNLRVLWNEQK